MRAGSVVPVGSASGKHLLVETNAVSQHRPGGVQQLAGQRNLGHLRRLQRPQPLVPLAHRRRPRLPNTSVTGFTNPSWCNTACNWFLARARCLPSAIRSRTRNRSCCVASSIHASGNKTQRDRCASVAESTRSCFSLAEAIAFTRCG